MFNYKLRLFLLHYKMLCVGKKGWIFVYIKKFLISLYSIDISVLELLRNSVCNVSPIKLQKKSVKKKNQSYSSYVFPDIVLHILMGSLHF